MPSARTKSGNPWWVDGGVVVCRYCARRYSAEVEYRCVACDASVCPHCVVILRERREVYCPSCPPDDGAD